MDFDSQNLLFRVVTIGETAVGKTSIINRLINNQFSNHENPTIGGNFLMRYENINDIQVELQIWDTAGQEKYRSLSPIYCRDASAGILVFDITNKETFQKLDNWHQIFTDVAGQDAILYVVANKCDLVGEEQVQREDAEKWAKEKESPIYFTSAKNGDNIKQLFHDIAEHLVATKMKDMTDPSASVQTNSQSRKFETGKSGGCC